MSLEMMQVHVTDVTFSLGIHYATQMFKKQVFC